MQQYCHTSLSLPYAISVPDIAQRARRQLPRLSGLHTHRTWRRARVNHTSTLCQYRTCGRAWVNHTVRQY
eukprot:3684288-Rhodomonas_salina.1